MDYQKALLYAVEKHAGQKRKNGTPYIEHPIAVANRLREKGYGLEYILTGLFHDLLEDTDATEEEIMCLSNADVLEAVKLLTKTENNEDYVDNILKNDIAKVVKNEDRLHNLREAQYGDPDFLKRYLKDTKEKYVGRFSRELDEEYAKAKKAYEKQLERFVYTIDTSVEGVIYRTDPEQKISWVYTGEEWRITDPYFWVELGDNAKDISAEEAKKYIS